MVSGFIRARSSLRQQPAALCAVRVTVAVQVEQRRPSIWKRPILLGPPTIFAHHVQHDPMVVPVPRDPQKVAVHPRPHHGDVIDQCIGDLVAEVVFLALVLEVAPGDLAHLSGSLPSSPWLG